ncbi:MAG TPA: SDR family NAD(P)-dependent oxidoreductase, partial [Rhodopila sp.]
MPSGNRLLGKVAIISGGASGIGAETARVFAAQGASVVLCDLQDDLGQMVAKEISDSGGTADYQTLDVCSEKQWIALVAATEQKYGKVNVLGNIAGISGRPPSMTVQTGTIAGTALAEQTLESWNRIMEVNATGVFLGTKSV